MRINTKSKYRGAILGTAIGDALGAPLECLSKDAINKQLPDGNWNYLTPNSIVRPPEIFQNVKTDGQWTDDTQLMRPILWSLINNNSINPAEIAKLTQKVYENEELRGWGGSTKVSIQRLSKGTPWFRASEFTHGCGNGVAMKAAPLGLYLSQYPFGSPGWRHVLNSIVSVGKITHNEVGITGGVMQSCLISLAANGVRNRKKIIQKLAEVENEFCGGVRFSGRLAKAVKLSTIDDIAEKYGVSSKADHSWVTTAAVFLKTRNNTDSLNNLYYLIRQGGDCDTTGAMYGALIGARWGVSVFNKNLRDGLEANDDLLRWSDTLFSVVENGENHKVNIYND
jgi:ADP-ribosylglycohydrolase